MSNKTEKQMLEVMHKNPDNWRGVFYFNKKDPRLVVPKITSTGWTLNFGSRWSYIVIVLFVLVIVASQLL